jgi:hypothetical protein
MEATNGDDKYVHNEERKKVLLFTRAALFLDFQAI